jgi:predicted TIM-barrel fold metal-dependent hydrolase
MLIDCYSKPPLPAFRAKPLHMRNYGRVYGRADAPEPADAGETLADYLAMYDACAARHVVIHAHDIETTFGIKISNESVAEFCAAHGERFIGFAGVDPNKGMPAIREFEHAIKTLGLRGLHLPCFELKLPINDARLYPLYAKCVELDVPVTLHCGFNFSTATSVNYSSPVLLDQVMVHFPELRVHVAPPGWPWVAELIGVAWRHENVHIGLAAVRPKYLAVPSSGYESLLQYGKTILQDRILFGSAHPLIPLPTAVDDIAKLDLPPAVARKWLFENAARFLRIGRASA